MKPKGSASVVLGIAALIVSVVDPVAAVPIALGAVGALFSPYLALCSGMYWLQPSILRELTFHAVLPTDMWGVILFMQLPFLLAGPRSFLSSSNKV